MEPVTSNPDSSDGRPAETASASRRRFLKVAGTGAVAVPVMETMTGRDLVTTAAKAQTAGSSLFDGPMTGTMQLANPG